MTFSEGIFSQAADNWDLETLYSDLSSMKGKRLTPVEKLHLRGLLCGHSPAEIAKNLNKSQKGVEVDLCSTLYQYVKNLVGKSNGKVENWRNITEWLEESGYKVATYSEYKISDSLSLNVLVKALDISVKKADIKIKNNQLLIDANIRVVTPLPSENTNAEELIQDEDIEQHLK